MRWDTFLRQEIEEPYFCKIREIICEDMLADYIICPAQHSMFRIFEELEYDDIKVVILGQDPYYANLNEANGFAFAVGEDVKIPSSLRNIFKEIADNFGGRQPRDRTLRHWVQQGVFLLNTALTTRYGEAFAHGKYWQPFTDRVIQKLGERSEPLIFMLWGAKASAKRTLIADHHFVLEAPHPSGLSAHRGFYGCEHFIKANQILEKLGKSKIDWIGYE
jgi:uracil-DNA glycosylase